MNIRYYRASDPQDANRQLQAWVDSDWAQCSDTRRSWTGIVITLAGDAVHYRSSMKSPSPHPQLKPSTSQQELRPRTSNGLDVSKEWNITLDTKPTSLHTTNLRIDNSGAIAMSTANGPTRRSKHIDIQYHFINEQVQNGQIRPVKSPLWIRRRTCLQKQVSASSSMLTSTRSSARHVSIPRSVLSCIRIDPDCRHQTQTPILHSPLLTNFAHTRYSYIMVTWMLFSLDGPEWVVKPQCVSSSCSLFLREAGRYSARLLRLCTITVFIH
jgi:hypothetical protein